MTKNHTDPCAPFSEWLAVPNRLICLKTLTFSLFIRSRILGKNNDYFLKKQIFVFLGRANAYKFSK